MKKISIAVGIYLVLSVLLFPLYQFYASTDIVSYISIAQKYAAGDWFNAINGVWGVLISLLLAPFLYLPVEPFVAFKILNTIIGACTLVGVYLLSKRFRLHGAVEWLMLGIMIPALISFALIHTTADLLVLCILVFYAYKIFDREYPTNIRNAICVGLLAGFGYFAKHYVFFFMLLHIPLSHVFHWLADTQKQRRIMLLKQFAISFGVFLALASVWVGVQSYKYGHFTLGTSAAYNHAWKSPVSKGHAPEYMGLVRPPNETANSMWEDLTLYTTNMPGYGWSIFENPRHQLELIWYNSLITIRIINKFALLLGPFLVLVTLWYVAKRVRDRNKWQDVHFLSLIMSLLMASGYILLYTNDRYIWIIMVLLLLIGTHWLSVLCLNTERGFRHVLCISLFIVGAISFTFVPVRRLMININQDKELYKMGMMLRDAGIYGHIASDAHWSNTSIMSFHMGTQYYGMPKKHASDTELRESFIRNEIDYYVVWNKNAPSFFDGVSAWYRSDAITVYKVDQK